MGGWGREGVFKHDDAMQALSQQRPPSLPPSLSSSYPHRYSPRASTKVSNLSLPFLLPSLSRTHPPSLLPSLPPSLPPSLELDFLNEAKSQMRMKRLLEGSYTPSASHIHPPLPPSLFRAGLSQ